MNITILTVGTIKEKYLMQAIHEYSRRLSRYCTLSHVTVADEKAPEKLSFAEEEQVKEREGKRLLKRIGDHQHVIALDQGGPMITSEAFAGKLERLAVGGKSQLVFVVGGSLGLARDVLERANEKLSFSPMTFPHQLMKVILLEQVYRGFKINRNEPYHK